MTDPPSVRQFSDREVALILKTAAELQQRDAPTARGLSLAELEQVAADVGMDPALIRRAVQELEVRGGASRHNRFLGGPTEIVVERVASGEVDSASFEDLLAELRAVSGELGTESTVGRLFGWRVRRALGAR